MNEYAIEYMLYVKDQLVPKQKSQFQDRIFRLSELILFITEIQNNYIVSIFYGNIIMCRFYKIYLGSLFLIEKEKFHSIINNLFRVTEMNHTLAISRDNPEKKRGIFASNIVIVYVCVCVCVSVFPT